MIPIYPSVVCFGEVLWDVLPTEKRVGGAPMNVAFHVKNLGIKAHIISAVGCDDLGNELLSFLSSKQIPIDGIQPNHTYSTSTVQVSLNETGAATYEIVEPVAWDFIHINKKQETIVEQADLFLFGSLSCRKPYSRKTLFQLIEKAKKTIFDVNLRAPFYSQDLIESLLKKADIVKVNDEELDIITQWYGVEKSIKRQLHFLANHFDVETVVMTKGKHGAYCLHDGNLIHQNSFQVEVADTVGAGDAFLAAFITKMLKGESWQQCLEFACAMGAIVATKSGGTPEVNPIMVNDFLNYQEAHRPQFHFSPTHNWMNDPNGLVYYEGEYHLFYQYYPEDSIWGPMHWGHSISKDLVYWEHLPIALYPDSLGYIFSGSAVIDWNNTSDFGKNGEPPMVAIFTHHNKEAEEAGASDYQYQSIAYSTDKGRNWTKYEGNPVVLNALKIKDYRDPKVIWEKETERWIMVFVAHDHIKIYASSNLKEWTYLSDWGQAYWKAGEVWECPDLFPMTVAKTGEQKWVLIMSVNPGGRYGGSGTKYFIGDFDGKDFVLDKQFEKNLAHKNERWLDYGRDNYAGVTWSDIPASDGRRLFIGWMSNWEYAQVVPTYKWRSAMTIPRELVLNSETDGYSIVTQPVQELKTLRQEKLVLNTKNREGASETLFLSQPMAELFLTFKDFDSTSSSFGLELLNTKGEKYRIGYDAARNEFFSDRTQAGENSFSKGFADKIHYAPRFSTKNSIQLHLFLDATSAELFADTGATVITDIFFPKEVFTQCRLFWDAKKVRLEEAYLYELKSIW